MFSLKPPLHLSYSPRTSSFVFGFAHFLFPVVFWTWDRLVQFCKPPACYSSVSVSVCCISVVKEQSSISVTHMSWHLKGWAGSGGFAGALFNSRGWAIRRVWRLAVCLVKWWRWSHAERRWRVWKECCGGLVRHGGWTVSDRKLDVRRNINILSSCMSPARILKCSSRENC